jgi:hypothetical protein
VNRRYVRGQGVEGRADELAQVPSRALYDALGTALGGRAQPLMLVISTQAASVKITDPQVVNGGVVLDGVAHGNAASVVKIVRMRTRAKVSVRTLGRLEGEG